VDPAGLDKWELYRRQMVAETERFIEWGLRHGDRVNWIPTRPATDGGFPPRVGRWFYQTVFGAPTAARRWWRRKLRRGIRFENR